MRILSIVTACLLLAVWAISSAVAGESSQKKLPEFVKVEIMPEMIVQAKPEYPEVAKEAGIECELYVKALIDKEGKVRKASIIKCTVEDQGFEEAAIKAALSTKFKPAIFEEKPVAIWVTYKVVFALNDEEKVESKE